jgi:hypothetical protein
MTIGQRKILGFGCIGIAAAVHLYVGDWSAGLDGMTYRYRPGRALAGFNCYVGSAPMVVTGPGIYGAQGGEPYYDDHRELALLFLGILFPIVLAGVGFLVLAGGRRADVAEGPPVDARPVKKG